MKALILRGTIIQVAAQEFEVHPDYQWVDCPDNCTTDWEYLNGVLTPPSPIIPTVDEILKGYQGAIKVAMDNKARERMYDNSISIATYVSSTNPAWKGEADAFVAWRDDVYVYALGILAQVQGGVEQPTIEEVLNGMPVLNWPN